MDKEEALDTVMANAGEEWRAAALAVALSVMAKQETFTGEDIRLACLDVGAAPHHPNAWGGFIHGLIRQQIVTPTGDWVPMTAPSSHKRYTRVYCAAA